MRRGEILEMIRAEFERELNKKNGWGKNEVLHLYDRITTQVIVKCYEEEHPMSPAFNENKS